MPRRLGDDPLARRRAKSLANGPPAAVVADGLGFTAPGSAVNPVDFPGPTPGPVVSSAEPGFAAPARPSTNYDQATSYNDVFFHRREEESAPAGGVQATEPQPAENPQPSPAAMETAPETPQREFASPISGVEHAPTEEAVHTPEPAAQPTANPNSLDEAPSVKTAEQQPEEPKKGFFKNIFSAFKKP